MPSVDMVSWPMKRLRLTPLKAMASGMWGPKKA